MTKPLTNAVARYNGLIPTDEDAVYKIRLYKDSATWSWFTENEVGGGFGSNAVTTQSDALARAATNIPGGTPFSVTINDEPRGTYARADSREV